MTGKTPHLIVSSMFDTCAKAVGPQPVEKFSGSELQALNTERIGGANNFWKKPTNPNWVISKTLYGHTRSLVICLQACVHLSQICPHRMLPSSQQHDQWLQTSFLSDCNDLPVGCFDRKASSAWCYCAMLTPVWADASVSQARTAPLITCLTVLIIHYYQIIAIKCHCCQGPCSVQQCPVCKSHCIW